MKFASLAEVKKELQLLPPKRLQDLCLRLAKYKKENKELLAFLLFEDDNKQVFIEELKNELEDEFRAMKEQGNHYYLKKNLRRVLRILNRYIKYLDDRALSVQLMIWFCGKMREYRLPLRASAQLRNIYEQQVKKTEKLIEGLHEDLQHDYLSLLPELKTVG